MKAKIKATGKIIEVEQRGSTFLNTNDGSLYNVKELDLNVVDDMMSEQEKWYWKDKRIQAAIEIAGRATFTFDKFGNIPEDDFAFCAKRAVQMADALIAELKEGDNNGRK